MTRWACVCLVLLACACSNAPVRVESRSLGSPVTESADRYIVAAVDNEPVTFAARAGSTPRGYDSIATYGPTPAARRDLKTLEQEYGLREVNAWPIEPLHMHCAVLEIPEGVDRNDLLLKLSHDPRIKLAQPLQTFATRSGQYNDPYVDLQLGFREMDVAAAHPWSRGDGIKVAIIDTGVDTGHPDLRGSIAAAANFVDADGTRFRRDRHGTEMAGVIAAVANNGEGIVGVAPGARLLVFKACWQADEDADAARCNSFTLARALVAAFDAHVQVINLSLAGPDDPLLRGLIREGVHRGVIFVGAAPAAGALGTSLLHLPGVIEVSSAESNAGTNSVLYAPGREILTLLPGGRYDFATGDSIATAQVTGVVALLLAKKPALTAVDAYRVLSATSIRTDAAGAATVDACAAVVSVVGQGSCAATDAIARRIAEHRVLPGR